MFSFSMEANIDLTLSSVLAHFIIPLTVSIIFSRASLRYGEIFLAVLFKFNLCMNYFIIFKQFICSFQNALKFPFGFLKD